jgi:hypothetical protein
MKGDFKKYSISRGRGGTAGRNLWKRLSRKMRVDLKGGLIGVLIWNPTM